MGNSSLSPLERASKRKEGKLVSALVSWRRLGGECIVLFVMCSWMIMLCMLFSSRFSECYAKSIQRALGRYVNIKSFNGILHWEVNEAGIVGVGTRSPQNATFHVEWHDEHWFCLRHMRDLRIVEVMDASDENPWALRTLSYGCTNSRQLFTFRGHGIFSKAANGYINTRESQYLRAHGDNTPWKPLLRETRQARIIVESIPGTLDDVLALEGRLLTLVADLEAKTLRGPGASLSNLPAANGQLRSSNQSMLSVLS